MAERRGVGARGKEVGDYRHENARRLNNPTAALAREDVAPVPHRTYSFDPHLPPELVWAGKAEETELTVEAPSIHVHERLSTDAILKAARQENAQIALFADPGLDRAMQVEFYEHEMGWANRLILGDSLVAMTSLLERERMAGQVQLVYIDPPNGINYNSNFQARISNRTPKETDEASITREPEQIQAYRDTWQLGVHSYLTYLRERLIVTRELLSDSGSVVVQIGPDNMHVVRVLLDEVFGPQNHCATVTVAKTSQVTATLLPEVSDFLLWYARDKSQVAYNQLYELRPEDEAGGAYQWVELDGKRRKMTPEEVANPAGVVARGGRIYTPSDATSQGYSATKTVDFEFEGRTFHPGPNRHWLLRPEGMQGLADAGRLQVIGNTLRYVRFLDDAGGTRRTNIWTDTGQAGFAQRKKAYVVETNSKIVERCVAMLTQAGDLVLDPTCGSGTTAYAAEKLGRRWITVDTSRVALALARERLLTSKFDYYELADPARGVDAGLRYDSFTWVTSSSIGYDEAADEVTLYDQPKVDRGKVRVSGPFTVEALSRYADNPFDGEPLEAVSAEATADHVAALLDALRTMGIPRKGTSPAPVVLLEPLAGVGALHAEGTFTDADGGEQPFAVSLGPRHGPITVAQIDEALAEAPGYSLIVFAGFAATAEAQQYLAPGRRGRINVALLEANADLLLGGLLKNTKASQTFRLFAAPEARVRNGTDGTVSIELLGMDSFDAATGEVVSRNQNEIAAWFLDHDYDGSVFHVNQAFFTRSNPWEALGKALRDTIDQDVVESMHSFVSLPFEPGPTRKAALRAVDDAGQTSEAILDLGA
jgi:adenine-specific DNA-methyltransferase